MERAALEEQTLSPLEPQRERAVDRAAGSRVELFAHVVAIESEVISVFDEDPSASVCAREFPRPRFDHLAAVGDADARYGDGPVGGFGLERFVLRRPERLVALADLVDDEDVALDENTSPY